MHGVTIATIAGAADAITGMQGRGATVTASAARSYPASAAVIVVAARGCPYRGVAELHDRVKDDPE